MLRRAALGFVLLLAPAAASCGAPLMRLPSGTSEPAPDAAAALAEATRACRAIHALTAEVAVSGSAPRPRGRGRLSAGGAPPRGGGGRRGAPGGAPLVFFSARGPPT